MSGYITKGTVALLALGSSLATAQDIFAVSAENASVMGLLSVVGDVLNQNVIVVGDPGQRVSAVETSNSKVELLSKLGWVAGLVHTEIEGIHVFSPSVCPKTTLTSLPLSD